MSTQAPRPCPPPAGAWRGAELTRIGQPRPRRGEIWFIEDKDCTSSVGTELWKNRPGVVVSNDRINQRSGFAQVVLMTSSKAKRTTGFHVDLTGTLEENRRSIAMCEQIHVVDLSRMSRRLGTVDADRMAEIDKALMANLDLIA